MESGKTASTNVARVLKENAVFWPNFLSLRLSMRWCCGASSIEPAGPALPLTAKQLVEKKNEAGVIAAQLAKPSSWDERGASALKAALADTVLVDAAWLVRLAKKRGVLPRCQDLPPGARVTLEEMEKWTHDFTVGVLVISYPWWAPPLSTLA